MLSNNIDLNNKRVLVTGAAGFIGANIVVELFKKYKGISIIGIDNMNDYYDVRLKEYRLKEIERELEKCSYRDSIEVDRGKDEKWIFYKGNIADKAFVMDIFNRFKPQVVVNMAAQAGVRHSINNPDVYIESNIIGFFNILEACRASYGLYTGVEHLVYASSSSIYGDGAKIPYAVEDKVDSPVSLYAATKKSNELMAHAYAKLYNIPCTGLRFFTVYGPAGRPDMAYFSFIDKLKKGEKIKVFNYGNCRRDFTYIDDIVKGVIKVMEAAPIKADGEDGLPVAPFSLYNIGHGNPVNLMDFIDILCQECKKQGVLRSDFNLDDYKELVPMQKGDVEVTYADTSALEKDFGYKPQTDLEDGIKKFVEWYKKY